jgi:predicted DNA-binding transcriptional regulator YafY
VATNKNATIRYQTLNRCFSNPGRKYYIDDLIEACNNSLLDIDPSSTGIKRRQVFDDIKFMRDSQGFDAPIESYKDGKKVYYRYNDLSFSINNQPLNENEANQLKEALLTISRFKGMPQFEWVDEISARLDSGLGLSHNSGKIIEFEQNSYLRGLEYITPIYNAILYQTVVEIEYKSFKQDLPQAIAFHPYFLKQYNNRWYIFGLNDANGFIMNLALDRISSIQESKVKFIPNNSIDFNEYFEDIVGVTVENNGKLEKVVLKVNNNLLPYIQTKPIHGSQKLKQQGDSFTIITFDLIPNYELESIILSYGEGIEVLEPPSLRNRISERINTVNNNYKTTSADQLHN